MYRYVKYERISQSSELQNYEVHHGNKEKWQMDVRW